MIAALICVVSVAALLQFFISYCRSVLASSRNFTLSEQVREVTGNQDAEFAPNDFGRILQLLRLCPETGDDQGKLRAVGAYFGMMGALGGVTQSVVPALAGWAERERRNCSYFAAVTLDRRIARSRDLFSRQLGDSV